MTSARRAPPSSPPHIDPKAMLSPWWEELDALDGRVDAAAAGNTTAVLEDTFNDDSTLVEQPETILARSARAAADDMLSSPASGLIIASEPHPAAEAPVVPAAAAVPVASAPPSSDAAVPVAPVTQATAPQRRVKLAGYALLVPLALAVSALGFGSVYGGYSRFSGSAATPPPATETPAPVAAAVRSDLPGPPKAPEAVERPEATPSAPSTGRGVLKIACEPRNASIWVDKRRLSATAARELEVPLDRPILLTAKLRGYKTWSKTVRPTGPETEIRVRLARKRR
jgi:hypothetical protein